MKKLDKKQLAAIKFAFRDTGHIERFEYILKEKGLLKEEFEVGKLYKHSGGPIINYQGGELGYGLDHNGEWCDVGNNDWSFECDPFEWKLANELETDIFKEALIKEAKKRGFRDGVKAIFCKGTKNEQLRDLTGDVISYNSSGQLCLGGNAIFYDGKWAEIVEEKKEGPMKVDIQSSNSCLHTDGSREFTITISKGVKATIKTF